MTDATATPLDEILALSEAMLAGARAQDWVTVANLEAARGALLRALFEGDSRPAPDALAAAAQRLLESDRVLLALGEAARRELSGELARLRQGRAAHAAYADGGHD
jgi:hypothetical protein